MIKFCDFLFRHEFVLLCMGAFVVGVLIAVGALFPPT